MSPPKEKRLIILILGALTALSPFSIDMYLPAFPQIANDLATTVAGVSLSLSSYFVGLAAGQLIYGPLLDRFGRKPPLYIGLSLYVLASLCCLLVQSIDALVVLRLFQALGGCVAGVTSMAVVRDLFSPQESAKVYSLLILILGTSPMLAPTIGGYVTAHSDWHSVFAILAVLAGVLIAVVALFLPESHQPDRSVSLKPGPIGRDFVEIFRDPRFNTYVLSGAIAFSGLFAYLAGSPVIFMKVYSVKPQIYGWIFGLIAAGMICASQLNVILLRKFANHQILRAGYSCQALLGSFFLVGTWLGWFGLVGTIVLLSLLLSCLGITNPNSAALALAPFARNAGRAAALMGFLQMSTGALVSTAVGLFEIQSILPIAAILASTSATALMVLAWGQQRFASVAN